MDEAHYMASLVHNLSLAAKLEAGEPDLRREPVDLSALIERVVARHQPIAQNHGVALERATPELPLLASGDVTFIEQAVSNLVLNALQHVEPGGHVAVTLDRVELDRFEIQIADDGPGMPAVELDRVLERGLRGNQARARAPNGRGLGLDIVHRVVRLHGWALTLAATEPRGLSVAIAGPLARA
jgi:signal transduction histidine kinase